MADVPRSGSKDGLSKPTVEYDSLFRDENLGARSFVVYFAVCFLGNGLMCLLTICLWSRMGLGDETIAFLNSNYEYQIYPFGASVSILMVMYLLDFFAPPFDKDGSIGKTAFQTLPGRTLLALAVALFLISCLLMAQSYPHVPMLLTIFLCPGSSGLARYLIKPKLSIEDLPEEEAAEIIGSDDVGKKMRYLKGIVGEERDVTAFYRGAMYSFFTCAAASVSSWLLWAHFSEDNLDNFLRLSATEQEKRFIKWVCPLVLAISNFVFGLFVVLRVVMQRNYARTDMYRARLVADGMSSSMHEGGQKHRATLCMARLSTSPGSTLPDEKLEEHFTAQHTQHIRQLSMIVKVVACTFVLFIGLLYVATQLLYANVYVASMVLGMLGAFFVVFVVFTYFSFKRIVHAMGQWIKDLPVWSTMKWLVQRDWLRAMFVCPGAPVLPMVLALSVCHQQVRRMRGAYKYMPEHLLEELGEDPSAMLLTPRVHGFLKSVRSWDWLSLAWWCYFWCAAFVAYNLTPPILNVGLAWMRDALRLWPFSLILVMTFLIGVGAFLCPVVPGMTVYIFGGLIVANTCPPPDRGFDAWVSWQEDTQTEGINDAGFWMGSIINIGLSWFLKLAACAVQQKLIGECLGSRMWVRQTVGVHKTHIRCIESILSKRGWSIGKVAILCGGPDWPTSVLAGVLRLSLFQCELGTVPIIGFVAPCAMTGSFYLRKSEGGLWEKSANLMIIVSVFVNLLLWAISAWAIAQELENNNEKLTAPLPQNVDLVWLDYKAAEVDKRCRVAWSDVPKYIRWIFILGAFAHIWVCHALMWGYSYLIGSFQVQDRIELLQPFSSNLYFSGTDDCGSDTNCKIELFSLAALMVFAVYFVSWTFYFLFSRWKAAKLRAPRKAAEAEVSQTEAAWKEAWLKDANEQQAARLQAAMPPCASSDMDPEKAGVSDLVADTIDVSQERPQAVEQLQGVEQPQAIGRPQVSEWSLRSRQPNADLSPPPMPVANEGEPVKLRAVSLTERDSNEDLANLPDTRFEPRETLGGSVDSFLRGNYIKCICCQLDATQRGDRDRSPMIWSGISLGECPSVSRP